MSKSTYLLKLPTSVETAAARLAKAEDVSLNQFIASAVTEKVGVIETAGEFVQRDPSMRSQRTCSSTCARQGRSGRPSRNSDDSWMRIHKPYGYLLGSYRIATAPEPNSSRSTSLKSTRFESPTNNVGPWPASLGWTTNSYSSINPSSANASGSVTPPVNSPLPGSSLSC